MKQPFIITSPDLAPSDREYWIMDPEAGPLLRPSEVAKFFYGWVLRTLNYKLLIIKDEFDVPVNKYGAREFSLFQVERITRLFLNRGIIDYRRFYAAMQVLKAVGQNHNLI